MSHKNTVSESPALQPMIYVCIASEFNLPELESCLLRRPQYLVLVVSDYNAIQNGAELLQKQVSCVLPGIQILRPEEDTQTSFNGRDIAGCLHWAREILTPYLNTLPNLPRVCNITGGSKAITMAMIDANMSWQWLDYKAENSHTLQRLAFNQGVVEVQKSEALRSARPETVARLYSSRVIEVPANKLISAQPQNSLLAAQAMWSALSRPEQVDGQAVLELFGDFTTGLESIWLYAEHQHKKDKRVDLSSQVFINQPHFSAEHLYWLKQWHSLAPQSVEYSDTHIELPSFSAKDDFKRWLSGDWLEQLAMQWLTEKIAPEKMLANLKINPLPNEKSSLGERETDIVVHTEGRTTVIEVKTDLPPNGKIRDLLEQITSLGNRLGRTRKILLIGPQLYTKIQPRLESIKKRCKADNVLLCYNKKMLLDMF